LARPAADPSAETGAFGFTVLDANETPAPFNDAAL